MEIKLARDIVEALNERGFDAGCRENYSGRGMYGRETAAIICECSIGDMLAAVIENADLFVNTVGEPLYEYVDQIRNDNMGLGMVIY